MAKKKEIRIAIAPGTLFDSVFVFRFEGTKADAKKFVELLSERNVQCTGMEYYKEDMAKSVSTGKIVGWLPIGRVESAFA